MRDFVMGDAQPLAEIEYDQDVKKYLAIPRGDREEWVRMFSPDLAFGWAVESNPEGTLAGRASLSKGAPGDAELQIVIAKSFWGRKVGRRVAEILIPAAFDELDAKRVVGTVHPENQPSLALLQAWNFSYCGKKDAAEDDWQRGHLIFELTRGAYRKLSAETGQKSKLTKR